MFGRLLIAAAFVLVPARGFGGEPGLEVRFDFLHNQLVLPVEINGTGPYNAILDTGTHLSTIDERLAQRLALPLAKTAIQAVGAGSGQASGRLASLPDLKLGGLSIQNLPAVALDLSKVSQELGRPLHLVLGYSFLNGRIVQIDFLRRRIRFLPEPVKQPSETTRAASFPMQFRRGSILPLLEDCFVNGARIPVTIDTGSSLGLILFPQAIARLGLEKLAADGNAMQAVGYLGAARLTKGWVRSLTLSGIDLGAVEVAYVEKGYGEREDPQTRGGNLGNAILQDFIVTLDYRNHLVTLEAIEP